MDNRQAEEKGEYEYLSDITEEDEEIENIYRELEQWAVDFKKFLNKWKRKQNKTPEDIEKHKKDVAALQKKRKDLQEKADALEMDRKLEKFVRGGIKQIHGRSVNIVR